MKNTLKITLTALVCITLIYSACKKADLNPIDKSANMLTGQKDVAKKLALSVYQSLSNQMAGDHIKTSGSNGLATMAMTAYTRCGDFEITPTYRLVTNGDTTREYKGNSKFTFMCDGTLWGNGYNINAYLLDDTLNTTVVASGIKNTFNDIINFHVKALDGVSFSTEGSSEANAKFVVFDKENTEKESHTFSTKYVFNKIVGRRTLVNDRVKGKFILGTVDFEYSENYSYTADASKNSSVTNTGFMFFKPDDTMEAFFKIQGSIGYYKYVINLITGEISEPKVVEHMFQ